MRIWRAMAAYSPPLRPSHRVSPHFASGRADLAIESAHGKKLSSVHSERPSKKRKSDERETSLLGVAKTTKPFADHKTKKHSRLGAKTKERGSLAGTIESDESLVFLGEQSLELDKAIPRRRSWTPVADQQTDEAAQALRDVAPAIAGTDSSIVFGGLSSRYGYSAAETLTLVTRVSDASERECTRRRKVELSDEAARSNVQLETQPKPKQKKRPLTITEKATELHRRRSGHDLVEASGEAQTATKSKGSTSKRKQKSKKGRAAAAAASIAPRILTHEESYRAFESQDLLFGTSSQLARDESPSLVRDIQRATLLSLEQIAEAEESGGSASALANQTPDSRSSLTLARSSRRLWAEASRDHSGSTVQLDVIDLTDSPYGMARLNLHKSPALLRQGATETTSLRIADDLPGPLLNPEAATMQQSERVENTIDRTEPRVADTVRPAEAESTIAAAAPTMPDYSTWTIEELQRAISRYGFKKMRNRKNMIGRLETCWQSLHPGAAKPSISTAAIQATSSKPARQKRTPKPKAAPVQVAAAEAESATVIAAADAAAEVEAETATNGALAAAEVEAETATDGALAAVGQAHLFAKIHEAIVTAPPVSNTGELSWHHKILLYDPIVIEDLTVWLNAGHLTRVGVDEEVAPRDVRDWCESRSVCCLWRLNLRGGVRIRF